MGDAFLCDAIRTPFGRYGGALSGVRTDDLAAIPLRALLVRNPSLDAAAIDDVLLGCANQAGEDNRNVARTALLLAGLPQEVPGATINRLCGSALDAIGTAARAIRCGEAHVMIAGGVESMSRAPYVMSKSAKPFARDVEMFDTTLGWRFVNPLLKKQYGVDSMAETAENIASEYHITRADQDRFALRSQERALAAQSAGRLAEEIVAVTTAAKNKGETQRVERDEHPRASSLEALAALPTPFRQGGSVTAGNASGINDGTAAVLLASEEAVRRFGLTARARVIGTAVAGVAPRIMGMGPAPATRKLLARLRWSLDSIDTFELNEAFAAQALAVMRELGLPDDAPQVNPNGGAIALGHPLGASGARLVTTALYQLMRTGAARAVCAMCIGVGQGIALAIERV
jgi:acetyl-CoA C-acetyltransferase